MHYRTEEAVVVLKIQLGRENMLYLSTKSLLLDNPTVIMATPTEETRHEPT